MSLTRIIVGHEWQLLRADPVASLGALVFLGLTVIALILGSTRARFEHRDVRALQERSAAQAVELATAAVRTQPVSDDTQALVWGPSHPDYVANERGTYIVLPAAPLLALAAGQSDVYPDHYRITARLRESQITGDELENPLMLFTGNLDVAFLFIYLYPLLILAACADLTATERVTGTLRMMLTQAVPLRTIVTGKILARAAFVVLIPVVVSIGSAVVTDAAGPGAERLLLWSAATLAYGCFWLGVAVLVNALGRTSGAIALSLAGIWLCIVVLVPSIGNLASRLIYPVPSRVEFATAMRAATRDAMVQGSQMLGRFLEDHPSAGTGVEGMRQYAMLQTIRDREVAKRSEPLRAAYDRQLGLQRRLMARLQYLSPAILMQLALTDIAGTSGDRHRRFHAQATDFQAAWQSFFEPRLLAVEPLRAADFDRLPRFEYVEEPTGDVLRRTLVPVAALALAGAALAALGLAAYSRYDVTGAS